MDDTNLIEKLRFLREIDRLKGVVRASPLLDESRKENSAEHSWHLAMYAFALQEHAPEGAQMERVFKMLLLHDIVEIDAGDTPIHGTTGLDSQAEAERQAAARLFGLLPAKQAEEMSELWFEFESAETPDARFAKSLDRLQPLIHNVETNGGTWREHGVSYEQVLERYGPTIRAGSPKLWDYAKGLVERHFEVARRSPSTD